MGTWEHFFQPIFEFSGFSADFLISKMAVICVFKGPPLRFFRENQRFPDAEPRMLANANHANQEFAELRLDPDDFSCYLLIFVGTPSATGWHGTLVPNNYRPRT